METLELSPTVFSILSSLIEEKVGIFYDLSNRDLLQEKVSARALDAGFNSLLDYYYFLRYDDASQFEFKQLVENLVVNETYFFREWASLKMLTEKFIVPHVSEQRKIRIWSAACSSGEEPLSLAMLLDSMNLLNRVEIVATDISERILQKAQNGRYGRRSLRAVPAPELVARYIRSEGDVHHIAEHLTSAVRWQNLNLLEFSKFDTLGTFDIIICRNVLIYFSDSTVKNLLQSFSKSLTPDGRLLIGVSESLFRYGNGYVGEEHVGSFIYKKDVQK